MSHYSIVAYPPIHTNNSSMDFSQLGFEDKAYKHAYEHWRGNNRAFCVSITRCKPCLLVFDVLSHSTGLLVTAPFVCTYRFTTDSSIMPIQVAQMTKRAAPRILEDERLDRAINTETRLRERICSDFPGLAYDDTFAREVPGLALETCKYAPMIVHGNEMYTNLVTLYRQCLGVREDMVLFSDAVVDDYMLLQFHLAGVLTLSCSTVDELWWHTIRLDKHWL